MKKRNTAAFLALILSFSLCLCSFCADASAVLTKNGSITLHVADANTGEILEGAAFRLYFFAQAHEKANGLGYEYVYPYEECRIALENLQDAYLPIHLTNFALSNSLPYTEKASDKSGSLIFDDLTPGIYLIVSSGNIPDYFVSAPFVINIPLYDENAQNWVYDINATPKMQIVSSPDGNETTYVSVKKIWDTDTEHPSSVTVSLLCDYKEYQRVVLSEENNWTYKWENLSKRHSWSVVEIEVPDGFAVSYEASANTVTITNHKKTESETTTKPDEESSSPDGESTTIPDGEPTTKQDELVDTGQLNWPVPVMSVAGLLLFSIGWAILTFGKKEKNGA